MRDREAGEIARKQARQAAVESCEMLAKLRPGLTAMRAHRQPFEKQPMPRAAPWTCPATSLEGATQLDERQSLRLHSAKR